MKLLFVFAFIIFISSFHFPYFGSGLCKEPPCGPAEPMQKTHPISQPEISHKTNFNPFVYGFHFNNEFVNPVIKYDSKSLFTTKGRCGGMAYASLDYYYASKPELLTSGHYLLTAIRLLNTYMVD